MIAQSYEEMSNVPQDGGASREDELVSSKSLDGAIGRVGGESDVEEVVLWVWEGKVRGFFKLHCHFQK